MSSDDKARGDLFTITKGKMRVQQRMIDLTARELMSTRISTQTIGERSSPGSALEENIILVENKLMKLYSRQLMHKHLCLNELNSTESIIEETIHELDQMISFDMFLQVTGIREKSRKALLDPMECLSVDKLFILSPMDLQQLFQRLDIPSDDCLKLVRLLDLMSNYYDKWEKGEKPIASDMRHNSSSGRLNSLTSLESCKNSSTVSPPGGNQSSRSSTPRSSTPVTPLTPSSTTPFLTLPHQNSVTSLQETMVPPPYKKYSTYTYLPDTTGYTTSSSSRHLSSSSSSLNSDQSNNQQQVVQTEAPPMPTTPSSSSSLRVKRKLGHTRSHSNPPLPNLIMSQVVPENSIPDYRSPSPPYYNGHAPPLRAGSHPSIVQNNTNSSSTTTAAANSTKSHPQVRRLMATANSNTQTFSKSVSVDQVETTPHAPPPPIRSNSEASNVQSLTKQRRLSKDTTTSASMVDLPLIRCSGDDESNSLPQSGGKSHSVPRLVNLMVNSENTNNNSPQLNHSISVPTSPRLPSNYNPTGVIGHKIDHRFVGHLLFGVHECDYCKKTLVVNCYKCRYCKYKCHKNCSKLAPSSCGLSRDFLNYARNLLMSPSYENIYQVNTNNVTTSLTSSPPKQRSVDYPPTKSVDDNIFMIQDLSKEPFKSQYSPVVQPRRFNPQPASPTQTDFSKFPHVQVPMRLEVPHPSPHHTHHYSTSSSHSSSTQSSPCITPMSPRSPLEPHPLDYHAHPAPPFRTIIPINITDESETDEDYQDSDEGEEHGSSSLHNLRPPAPFISAQSLPNLLLPDSTHPDSSDDVLYTSSEDNLQSWHSPRKSSITGTISTAESKTSTLVESIIEEDDSSSLCDSEINGQGVIEDDDISYIRFTRSSLIDEWIIPYGDLKLVDKLGSGEVTEVYRGYWHGQVAVKKFNLTDVTPEELEKFKEEVAILKKTRHENLALFMGACFDPPNLAIVTSFCQGYTLYKLVHYWSEVFLLERLVNIGRQIAQAMGYLHARGIIHKGLNSKNIFLEKTTDRKEKVIITDMGLSAFSNLLITGRPAKLDDSRCLLRLTHTQIYYLAPEIVRMISPHYQVDRDICPFTFATDMYSFGTILYELITRKYPFVTDSLGFGYETEVVLYLIGRGYKQPFKATDVPKQLKDIVWECWSTQPDDRPSFRELQERLARLCRKHTPITRSPSHPINLSKSVDNLLYI